MTLATDGGYPKDIHQNCSLGTPPWEIPGA